MKGFYERAFNIVGIMTFSEHPQSHDINLTTPSSDISFHISTGKNSPIHVRVTQNQGTLVCLYQSPSMFSLFNL